MEKILSPDNQVIGELASSIDELINNYIELKAQHQTLKQSYQDVLQEKKQLLAQHQAVKEKISTMINRLHTME